MKIRWSFESKQTTRCLVKQRPTSRPLVHVRNSNGRQLELQMRTGCGPSYSEQTHPAAAGPESTISTASVARGTESRKERRAKKGHSKSCENIKRSFYVCSLYLV